MAVSMTDTSFDLLQSDGILDTPDRTSHNVPYPWNINDDYQKFKDNDPSFAADQSQNATTMTPVNPCTTDTINTSTDHPHGNYAAHETAYTGEISSGRQIAASYSEALSRSTVPSDGVQQDPYPGNLQINNGYPQPLSPYFGAISTQPKNIATNIHQPRNISTNIQPTEAIENVSDYLCLSVVGFLFCWLIGICAIVTSVEVGNAKKAGSMQKAKDSSKHALYLSIVAIICGVVLIAVMLIVLKFLYGAI